MVMATNLTNNFTMHHFAPLSEIPPKTFETERLILRAITPDDCALMFRTYTSDPVITKYMSFPRATSPEDSLPFAKATAANFKGQVSDHKMFGWLVFLKDTGECVGSVGIGPTDATTVSGGYLFTPSSWGKGIATEAWRPLVEWVKGQPNVQRLDAEHHPDNPASGSVMRKLGLTCEGVFEKHAVLPNLSSEKVDMVVWAWTRAS